MEQETVHYCRQSVALTFGQGIPDHVNAPSEQYDGIACIVVKSGPSSIFPIFLLFFLILLAHILPFVTLLLLVCHLTSSITNDRIFS